MCTLLRLEKLRSRPLATAGIYAYVFHVYFRVLICATLIATDADNPHPSAAQRHLFIRSFSVRGSICPGQTFPSNDCCSESKVCVSAVVSIEHIKSQSQRMKGAVRCKSLFSLHIFLMLLVLMEIKGTDWFFVKRHL